MTLQAIGIGLFIVSALIWRWELFAERRGFERERAASAAEREKWRLERAELLNRIQHPEVFQRLVAGGRSGIATSDIADDMIEAVQDEANWKGATPDSVVFDEADLVGTIQTGEPSGD